MLLRETLPHNSIKRLGDYGLLKLIHPTIEERTIYNDLAKAYETIQGIELLFLKKNIEKNLFI